jgi:hypothetical protein
VTAPGRIGERTAVIADSVPWKRDLLRIAAALEKRKVQARVHWTERTSFLVERDIMIGAYAVRKLVEARKLSDELCAERVAVRRHALKGSPPDIWNRDDFWDHYDMTNGKRVPLSLTDLCNQIVHSYVWMMSATEDWLFDGIYVSSDRERMRSLYFIGVDALIDVFRSVGMDDVVSLEMRRDDDGVMHITRASREPQLPDPPWPDAPP